MNNVLNNLGLNKINSGAHIGGCSSSLGSEVIDSINPSNNKLLAKVSLATLSDYEEIVDVSYHSWKEWRMIPAPQRGEVVRQIGMKLREQKDF